MIFSREKLFALKKALLKLGSVSTEDGTTLVYDNDVLEVGAEVFIDGDEGMTPAPDKDYIYDGKTITVEGGIVTAIVENEIEQTEEETTEEVIEETTEEETTEVTEEEKSEEENTEETEEVTEEETTEEETEETIEEPTVDELKAVIDEQKAVIEDLKAQIEELTKRLEEPAAEPAEEEFKNQKPTETSKIDFSRYIKKTNKNI